MRRPLRRVAAESRSLRPERPAWGVVRAMALGLDAGTPSAPFRKAVVDASIVAKWLLPEPYSTPARRLLSGGFDIHIPDLAFSELGMMLKKRISGGEMSENEAAEILLVLRHMPLQIHRTWTLAGPALDVERLLQRSIYQCLHLALAVREGAILVTSDKSLYQAAVRRSLGANVCWVEDVP
ncbi:MAG: type II toxin-antitoxin system VapC family toxin [Capsulimonadaceae bacterium]